MAWRGNLLARHGSGIASLLPTALPLSQKCLSLIGKFYRLSQQGFTADSKHASGDYATFAVIRRLTGK